MSASVCSSSLRIPVRVTKSSTDLKRGGASNGSVGREGDVGRDGCAQSCEHVLQKYEPAFTVSIIVSSSHPHLGQIFCALCSLPFALSMARPMSCRSPET